MRDLMALMWVLGGGGRGVSVRGSHNMIHVGKSFTREFCPTEKLNLKFFASGLDCKLLFRF